MYPFRINMLRDCFFLENGGLDAGGLSRLVEKREVVVIG